MQNNLKNNVSLARTLRKKMTSAEKLLWQELRRKNLGFKFRRQCPLGPFIVDFYCPKLKLVIELDGEVHAFESARKRDRKRQKFLENQNLIVKRFWNNELFDDINSVAEEIYNLCHQIIDLGEQEKEVLRKEAINVTNKGHYNLP